MPGPDLKGPEGPSGPLNVSERSNLLSVFIEKGAATSRTAVCPYRSPHFRPRFRPNIAPRMPAPTFLRQRPYCVECTRSHPNSEVKQRKARSVLGWGTAWEVLRVLLAFCFFKVGGTWWEISFHQKKLREVTLTGP